MKKQTNGINEFKGQIALEKRMLDLLEMTSDSNEQYNQRTSIRIHGTKIPENESVDNVTAVVNSCHRK